jgi:uncharacterized protein YjdB
VKVQKLLSLPLSALFLLLSCANGSPSTDQAAVPMTGISLEAHAATIAVGEDATLVATISPANATVQAVVWTSSDPSIATVSAGLVHGLAEGTVLITAASADGGKYISCLVTVTAAPTRVPSSWDGTYALAASPDAPVLAIHDGAIFSLSSGILAQVFPDAGSIASFTYSYSQAECSAALARVVVLSYSRNTATGAIAYATSTGTALSYVPCSSTHVAAIYLSAGKLYLSVGDAATLTASILPAGATDQAVTWASDAESVAAVSTAGLVSALAAGTATITATAHDGGLAATCSVTVSESGTAVITAH